MVHRGNGKKQVCPSHFQQRAGRVTTVSGAVAVLLASSASASAGTASLVPATTPLALVSPAYWCSWQAQERAWLGSMANLTTAAQADAWRHRTHQVQMDECNEANAIHGKGHAGTTPWTQLFPRARSDMFFMLDNGWQAGAEGTSDQLHLSPTRWSSFQDPADPVVGTLARLSATVKRAGWRGLGLWTHGDSFPTGQLAKLHAAGVGMLKLDGGDGACTVTAAARTAAPGLIVEHGDCVSSSCPFNDGGHGDGRWPYKAALAQAHLANCTDLFRTYDTVRVLSISEALDRQAKLLQAAVQLKLNGTGRRLFGGSGAPAVTGALGGSPQPMRSAVDGARIPPLFQVQAGEGPHSRRRQHRQDEVERLVRWARIAPPYPLGVHGEILDTVAVDETALFDAWNFSLADDNSVISHHLEGTVVRQGAPARVSRGGLPLPSVAQDGSATVPFVLLTQYPPSAATKTRAVSGRRPVAVTTLGRTLPLPVGYVEPRAAVGVALPGVHWEDVGPIGVFGVYESLTLSFASSQAGAAADSKGGGPTPPTVLMQDLATDGPALDVSANVTWHDAGTVTVPGALVDSVGLSGRSTPTDSSPPGLVMVFQAPPPAEAAAEGQ